MLSTCHFATSVGVLNCDCSLFWDELVLPEGEEDVQTIVNLH